MSFFRAVTSATQSLPGATETELQFGNELSDPDSCFASNRLTVPPSWNGRVGALAAGYRFSADRVCVLRIQRQAGGVGPFVTIAEQSSTDLQDKCVAACPIVFSTGDVYRVVYLGAAVTKNNDVRNFFAGWVYPTSPIRIGMFRAEKASSQTVASSSLVQLSFETEIIDSHNAYASNVLTVPASFDGGFVHLTAGVDAFATDHTIYIQQSMNGGSSWLTIATNSTAASLGETTVDSGAIAAVAGHMYRVMFFQDVSGTDTVQAVPQTFFAGLLFR